MYLPQIGQDGYRHQSSVDIAAPVHSPNTLEYQNQEIQKCDRILSVSRLSHFSVIKLGGTCAFEV